MVGESQNSKLEPPTPSEARTPMMLMMMPMDVRFVPPLRRKVRLGAMQRRDRRGAPPEEKMAKG